VPEGAGGECVAAGDERRLQRVRKTDEARAGDTERIGIGKRNVFREVRSPSDEFGIESVEFAFELVADWLFVGSCFAQRHIAGGPVFWNLAGVDFIGEITVEYMVGPDG